MKIALIGTHGSGKTTLCYLIAGELQKRGASVGLVTETASECPLPINQSATIEAQLWMLGTQLKKEMETGEKHALTLCDRSLLDYYVYCRNLIEKQGSSAEDQQFLQGMAAFVRAYMPSYGILFRLPGKEDYLKENKVRSTSTAWQQEIDDLFSQVLDAWALPHLAMAYDATPSDFLNEIFKTFRCC